MFKKKHPPAGARPGTLVERHELPRPRISLMSIALDRVDEHKIEEVSQLAEHLESKTLKWIDVQGLGDNKILQELADLFSFHPLLIEDIVNTPQRPKTEEYEAHLLLVTRMITVNEEFSVDMEQVSIILGDQYVVTFQERYGDILEPIRNRIRLGLGPRIRKSADYLSYAIFDAIIDGYFPIVETLGDQLEDLEEMVLQSPTPETLQRLHDVKNLLVKLRRVIWPQRDAMNVLVRGDSKMFSKETRLFLRDTHDHCVQLTEVIESYRELVSGLMGTYLSVVSNKMNEVMKVLTIMASIFIPLTFMAGLYGMNFDNMPELHITWFYPLLLVLMAIVSAFMLWFFIRKGWIGSGASKANATEQHPIERR